MSVDSVVRFIRFRGFRLTLNTLWISRRFTASERFRSGLLSDIFPVTIHCTEVPNQARMQLLKVNCLYNPPAPVF